MSSSRCALALAVTLAVAHSGCSEPGGGQGLASAAPPPGSAAPVTSSPPGSAAPSASTAATGTASLAATSGPVRGYLAPPPESVAEDEPLAKASASELLALVTRPRAEGTKARFMEGYLERTIAPDTPTRSNQGNPELAHHDVTRRACLAALAGVVLQSDEQKRICKGHELMVPIYGDGDPSHARACIDVFEFPNKPCELPFVWVSPTQARKVCEAEGKRLCTQAEWVAACRLDPAGGEPFLYSYGNELDLAACNTNKPAAKYNQGTCDPDSARSAWKSCSTNTEPTGAFPRCRSRLGVYDLQGNVAEIMTRRDPEEQRLVSQLKGSAFFYVDVHRKDTDPYEKGKYSDRCDHDPRWHVEPMQSAWHVNYHLGFRCCVGLP
ncbi:MAG: SUMF1/EgtB/PvdO family nonheme iron enzyme [Polyangiaceae bacterium]|nr:SUMF1/EgtB/PvdO family nonheme iron enzyme [Polyangiaceae bacterium]